MKIFKFDPKKGEVKLQAESLNDLWVLYNVVYPGDKIEGKTTRRVVIREGEKGDRRPMHLGIVVEAIAFDEFVNRLRIKGQIYIGPEDFVSKGSYHTLNIEPGDDLTIIKSTWYDHLLQRLKKSVENSTDFKVLIIPIDAGDGIIALLTNFSQTIIAKIHENIPGKRFGKAAWEQEMDNFFGQLAKVIEENLNKYQIKLIMVVGPGFTKEKFAEYLQSHVPTTRGKVKTESATSAEESAIYEVLRKGSLQAFLQNQRVVYETDLIEEVLRRIGKSQQTLTFGIQEARQAAQFGAIEKFLISDVKFRECQGEERQKLEELLNTIESKNGKIEIVSSLHPAGEQLLKMSGFIGLLRFKVENKV